jgi:hypothetical protein
VKTHRVETDFKCTRAVGGHRTTTKRTEIENVLTCSYDTVQELGSHKRGTWIPL